MQKTLEMHCENCNKTREMSLNGPVVCEKDIGKMPDLVKYRNYIIYTCNSCGNSYDYDSALLAANNQ